MPPSGKSASDALDAALRRAWKFVLVLGAIAVGGYVLLWVGVNILLYVGTASTSTTLSPAEVSRHVSAELRNWHGFPKYDGTDPPPPNFPVPTGDQIVGIRGHSISGGFHGDGDDWYEFRLDAGVSEQLLSQLPSSEGKPPAVGPPSSGSPPAWWPSVWPEGTKFFRQQSGELAIDADGLRGWYHRIRS